MRRLLAIVGVLMVLGAVSVLGQEQGGDQAAMMEAWNKAMTPGEFHAFFAKKAGNWKIVGKMWMDPAGEPITSETDCVAEMILGGRYLTEKIEGMSMGMPFEAFSVTGYDNMTGKVTTTWYDNMGTATSIFAGKYETPGDPLEQTGSMLDPMTGNEVQVRMVTTSVSEDEWRLDYFTTMGAGTPEMKSMELYYTRVE